MEKRVAEVEAEKEAFKMKCAEYEEQLEFRTEAGQVKPNIDAYSDTSEITVSKFGGFAERRVPIGHPSSNGKSSIMQSAFTNKLS